MEIYSPTLEQAKSYLVVSNDLVARAQEIKATALPIENSLVDVWLDLGSNENKNDKIFKEDVEAQVKSFNDELNALNSANCKKNQEDPKAQ